MEDNNEQTIEGVLIDAIALYVDEGPSDVALSRVDTFEDAGVMTTNRGLVIGFGGREYQITIVRSR